MTDFDLSDHDKASGLWRRLEAHLAALLAASRARNDNETLTEQQTAALRGRINCLKVLIALGDDRPIIVTGNSEQPPIF